MFPSWRCSGGGSREYKAQEEPITAELCLTGCSCQGRAPSAPGVLWRADVPGARQPRSAQQGVRKGSGLPLSSGWAALPPPVTDRAPFCCRQSDPGSNSPDRTGSGRRRGVHHPLDKDAWQSHGGLGQPSPQVRLQVQALSSLSVAARGPSSCAVTWPGASQGDTEQMYKLKCLFLCLQNRECLPLDLS